MVFKLNRQEFITLQNRADMNMVEMASALGVSRAQLWRILNGKCNPGEQFIAGFKKAFPKENFDNFFLIDVVQRSDTIKNRKSEFM